MRDDGGGFLRPVLETKISLDKLIRRNIWQHKLGK